MGEDGEGGDEAAGVEGEEGVRFVVGVYFDVFVGEVEFFEGEPGALDEAVFVWGELVNLCGVGEGLWFYRDAYGQNQPE